MAGRAKEKTWRQGDTTWVLDSMVSTREEATQRREELKRQGHKASLEKLSAKYRAQEPFASKGGKEYAVYRAQQKGKAQKKHHAPKPAEVLSLS